MIIFAYSEFCRMKHVFYTLAAFAMLSCTAGRPDVNNDAHVPDVEDNVEEEEMLDGAISAEKESWITVTRGSDDRAFAKDIPWEVGDKVLLLGSDQSFEACSYSEVYYDENGVETGGMSGTDRPTKKTICTVSKIAGLKCTLVPDTPLEEGTYRAFYPLYDIIWYDKVHLSFLYEIMEEGEYPENLVVSEPVEYKDGHKLKFVMKHICALVDIDIYPPKTGEYTALKLFAQSPVFAGKANIWVDGEYSINDFADGWLNFTTLRGNGRSISEGTVFPTSTALLPIEYAGMPMTVHLVYEDGTHYVSDPFAMPSLRLGEVSSMEIRNFQQTDAPLEGLWGDCYNDPAPTPYPID